jgi:quinol monooxygenase YgiN
MSKTAVFIKHRALPGKREEVRRVWEKHLQSRIKANLAHEVYFYCYDDNDPDVICAFQMYTSRASSQDFLKSAWYSAYLREVKPLLAGEPEIQGTTPIWAKGAVV